MGWVTDNRAYEQPIIRIMDKGEQFADTMNCCIIRGSDGVGYVQYPRTLVRDGRKFSLLKYSYDQDIVFYKLRND